MKYRITIVGFILFLIGFILASRAYDFLCSCKTPTLPINQQDLCYQCMTSSRYQNSIMIFQIVMIVSVFIVFYGFFSEFGYGQTKNVKK